MQLPKEAPYSIPVPDAIYDDVELSVCIEWTDKRGHVCCEAYSTLPIDVAEKAAETAVATGDADRWFYSVYWHLSEGGTQHVSDFEELEDAQRLYCVMKAAVHVMRQEPYKAIEYVKAGLGVTP